MIDESNTIKILEKKLQYLFITRGESVLKGQISLLEKLESEILKIKENYIKNQDENNANMWLSVEELCKSFMAGLEMFLLLKNGKPDDAWIQLITAQDHARCSNSVYGLPKDLQKQLILHFNNIEIVLFPSQSFMSTSTIVEKSICSICKKEFQDCDHIKNEPYMGKLCSEIITEVESMREVSLVFHPADKKCRVTHTGNTNPPGINMMTLEHDSE